MHPGSSPRAYGAVPKPSEGSSRARSFPERLPRGPAGIATVGALGLAALGLLKLAALPNLPYQPTLGQALGESNGTDDNVPTDVTGYEEVPHVDGVLHEDTDNYDTAYGVDTAASSQRASVHGIDVACLDTCAEFIPATVAAIRADPVDCNALETTKETPDCFFLHDVCNPNLDGDLTGTPTHDAILKVLERSCPRPNEGYIDADTTPSATPSASMLGSDAAAAARPGAQASQASTSDAARAPQRSREFKVLTPQEAAAAGWQTMPRRALVEKSKEKDVRFDSDTSSLGHYTYSLAPEPQGVQQPVQFQVDTKCISAEVKGKFSDFFAKNITGAYVVKHNFGTYDFFNFEDAIKMTDGISEVVKCMSTVLGLVCPEKDGRYMVTTDQVDFEWGFALENEDGAVLYEIGKAGAPLAEKPCDDIQLHHPYWNRIMTVKDKTYADAIAAEQAKGDAADQERITYLQSMRTSFDGSRRNVFGMCEAECALPPFSCPEGSYYMGGTCVLRCPPGMGGTGNTDSTRRCVACPTNCNACLDGVCQECTNSKYLHEGKCVDKCPGPNFVSGGSQRRLNLSPADFDEFSSSLDAQALRARQAQPVFENNYPYIYFGHGYGAIGTAEADSVFNPDIGDVDSWTEAWISAMGDDRCEMDKYSTGRYCTFSKPRGDGNANCCTHWGKRMDSRILAELPGWTDDDGEPMVHSIVSGFTTMSGGDFSKGEWVNGKNTGSRDYGRFDWRNISWTTRLERSGTVSTWKDWNMKRQGIPTRAPDFSNHCCWRRDENKNIVEVGKPLGNFKAFALAKTGGWAEGGAVMSEISGMVRTSKEWTTGRYCKAA